MKLFYSPFHSFIHKVLVVAHEAGLWDDIDFVATFPYRNLQGEHQGDRFSLAALNPLNKVPTLALESGQVIFGSQSIVEYLDHIGTAKRKLYPAPGPDRWDALSRLALCDTMFETTVSMVMEGWQGPEHQRKSVFEWIWPKIIGGLDSLERRCAKGFSRFDVGQAAALHAVSYIQYRSENHSDNDPLYSHYDWRMSRPNLVAWYNEAIQRPSVLSHYQIDFNGDASVERFQRKVADVLKAQGQ